MKSFPENINAKNKDKFPALLYERAKCYLRRNLYEHILKEEEKSYFCLDKFSKEWINDIEKTKDLVKEIIPELEKLGWKCKLSYNDTGLFIYSTQEPPTNCW